jgi:putative ABC transport system permease protein
MRFTQDLKYALRLLQRDFFFTVVVVLTLALGIALSTSVFTIVDSVLLRKLPYRDDDRILSVAEQNKSGTGTTISFSTYAEWKERAKSLAALAVYTNWQPTITDENKFQPASGIRVSYDFFNVLGIRPRLGRDFAASEDHPGENLVIVSNAFWQKYFNSNSDVIGRTISVNGKAYMVIGVLPANFTATGFEADQGGVPDIWGLLGYDRALPDACRSCRHFRAIARVGPSMSVDQAHAELAAIEADLAGLFPTDYPTHAGAVVVTLQDKLVHGVRPALYILFALVLLLLFTVCANISSLFFSRAIQRTREIELRISLGATRLCIIRQLLIESVVVALLGGMVGSGLAVIAVRFVYLLNSTLPRVGDIGINGAVLGFALLLSLLAGAILGLTPSLLLSRGETFNALKENSWASQGRHKKRFQDALVVSEIAFALVLMGSAGLLLKSFRHLMSVNPGFETNNLVAVDISLSESKYDSPAKLLNFYHQVLDRVQAQPGVQSAAVVSTLPIAGGYDRVAICLPQHSDCEGQDKPRADRYIISAGYISTMRISLLQGRGISDQDTPTSPPVVLVGNTLAKQLGAEPIGQHVKVGDQGWATVIGVVGDVRQYGLDVPAKLQVYVSNEQQPQSATTLVVRTALNPTAVESSLRTAIGSVDKEQSVFNTHTMDEYLALSVSQQQFTMMLSTVFGAAGFFLAVLGIYGLTSYSVSQRTQEIGIRMALGAQPRSVFGLILKKVVGLTVLGVITGTAGAVVANRAIGSLLFETSPADLVTYTAVVVVLAATALLAGYLPARRAMKVNPIKALRFDTQ